MGGLGIESQAARLREGHRPEATHVGRGQERVPESGYPWCGGAVGRRWAGERNGLGGPRMPPGVFQAGYGPPESLSAPPEV